MLQHWITDRPASRREWLFHSGIGFGGLALAALLKQQDLRAEPSPGTAARRRTPHFTPRAKRVIFLFMHGGPSQVDTFDYKPELQRRHGQPYTYARPRIVSAKTGNLMASPFRFHRCGESGIPVSEIFPETGKCIDDICLINSMWGSNSRHGSALLELHTGSDTFIRPSMGSWITYGLGTENEDLPGFITICPTLGHGGANAWSSAFLPARYTGTPIGYSSVKAEEARIGSIQPRLSLPQQRRELDLLREINMMHLNQRGPDDRLESRIEAFELAFRMQSIAPEVQDYTRETAAVHRLYGIDQEPTRNFGIQCLMARRFAEAGVRFVQVTHSYKWDAHGELEKNHRQNALEVDRPIAGLIKDLKQRGMLDDTLVLWGGEFGRTPTTQGDDGRDHNNVGYTMFLAGGGVRGGLRYGATDEFGYFAVEDKVHLHDLHATMLYLLGLDHERLTYRHAGRDFRLTDVKGRVVHGVVA
ncbi:MAG: sulfatase [Pirellulaceae bacterium]|nr:MAG: sulfatase [Pirellulaceae bacterium]